MCFFALFEELLFKPLLKGFHTIQFYFSVASSCSEDTELQTTILLSFLKFVGLWFNGEKTSQLRQILDGDILRKSPISHNMLSFSPFQQVFQGFFMIFPRHIHELYDLHGIYMIFSIVFVISTCRAHLAENQTNLAENMKKKVGICGTHGTCVLPENVRPPPPPLPLLSADILLS